MKNKKCPYCNYYEHLAYGSYYDKNGIITDVPKGVNHNG